MKGIEFLVISVLATSCGICLCADQLSPPAYLNNFEQVAIGKPPEDLMILGGTFSVIQDGTNKCLELAADPLDADGLLFGPAGSITGDVAARIWSSASGKRFPEFGIGSNDAGGYKLILVPAQGIIELRKGDEVKTSAEYAWKSDGWTQFRLRVTQSAVGKFHVEGKAWSDKTPEPPGWAVSVEDSDAPPAGRASVWGMPYSGKPIRFDDLSFGKS